MPVLENPKHEIFAQCISAGMSRRDAYLAAGYEVESDEAARAAGSRLLALGVNVSARVRELNLARTRSAAITAESIASECDELARIA